MEAGQFFEKPKKMIKYLLEKLVGTENLKLMSPVSCKNRLIIPSIIMDAVLCKCNKYNNSLL